MPHVLGGAEGTRRRLAWAGGTVPGGQPGWTAAAGLPEAEQLEPVISPSQWHGASSVSVFHPHMFN